MVKDLEKKPYKEQLRSLHLFSLEETEARPHSSRNLLKKRSRGVGTDLFTLIDRDRTQGNGMKLSQEKFRLDVTECFSPREWWGTETGSSGKWSQHQHSKGV
ncbi:hypothetical protein DUI87_16216 [Hirundo rustica rustica]|uniref:Uncharacterized protein n=1 Tax=Hirundo rustica rustica TaxID=333673 RepID=A0A3M0K6T0_HIRRU|nr:hypothetical protein DUI87_16216 [Hirundo rustica rustica]